MIVTDFLNTCNINKLPEADSKTPQRSKMESFVCNNS